MPVEQADAVDDEPLRGVHLDLSRQARNQPNVVVAQDHPDPEPSREERGEEVEHHRPKRARGPDDRMLHVAHDDQSSRAGRAGRLEKLSREELGRGLRRPSGARRRPPETEVEVRDQQDGAPFAIQDQRRAARYRLELGQGHARRTRLGRLTVSDSRTVRRTWDDSRQNQPCVFI